MARRKRRFPWLTLLLWLIPSPLASSWPADLLAALSRTLDVARSLIPDAPITAPRGNVYASAPLCADATQINVTVSDQWRAFEDMNVNDCNRMVRVVTNTSLTPGTGQLRLNLYANATGPSTNSSIQ